MDNRIDDYISKGQFLELRAMMRKEGIPITKDLADRILKLDQGEAFGFYYEAGLNNEACVLKMYHYPLPFVRMDYLNLFLAEDILLNDDFDFIAAVKKAVEMDAPGEGMVIALLGAKRNRDQICELTREMEAFAATHGTTLAIFHDHIAKN